MNPSGVVQQQAATPETRDRQGTSPTFAWAPRIALLLGALSAVLVLAALGLLLSTRSTPTPPTWGFRGFALTFSVAFTVVGVLLAARRPRNVIGWFLCVEGILAALQGVVYEYAVFAVMASPGGLPGGEVAAWVDNWFWIVGMGPIGTLGLLLFPSGRLPTPRWRPVAWLGLGGTVLGASGLALTPGPLNNFPSLENPYAFHALSDVPFVFNIVIVPMVLAIALSASSLVIRFRQAESGVERQQLKWFAYAGALLTAAAVINQVEMAVRGSPTESLSDFLVILSALAIPAAIGVAVLRYRLYDIDLVINRTLVYVPLTAILAGVYMAFVGIFKALVTDVTGLTSDAAVAFTTLMVVALVTPLKNTLQGLVDRYFKEAPDAAKDLRKFDSQVRQVTDVLDQGQIGRRFLAEAAVALQAEAGAIYLGQNGLKRVLCTHGAWTEGQGERIPLQANGEEIGELWLVPQQEGRPQTAQERAALEGCAAAVAKALVLAGGSRTT